MLLLGAEGRLVGLRLSKLNEVGGVPLFLAVLLISSYLYPHIYRPIYIYMQKKRVIVFDHPSLLSEETLIILFRKSGF